MEADWEIEIGGDAPVIDAAWTGFIDLRTHPERAAELAETTQLPALEQALRQLNAPASPVWTSRCDVWEPAEFDPLEMEANPAEARFALACYLDLLPRSEAQRASAESATAACRSWCTTLHTVSLSHCRVDLVIRRAWITPDVKGLGVTAYLSACGRDLDSAQRALTAALAAFADAVATVSASSSSASKYNEGIAGE